MFNPWISILIIVKVMGTKSNFKQYRDKSKHGLRVSWTNVRVNPRCGFIIYEVCGFWIQISIIHISLVTGINLLQFLLFYHSTVKFPLHCNKIFIFISSSIRFTLIIEVDFQQTISSYRHYITFTFYNNIRIIVCENNEFLSNQARDERPNNLFM